MAQHTYKSVDNFEAKSDRGLDGQVALIRVNSVLQAYRFDDDPRTFITISLENTNVTPSESGTLAFDGDDVRGWFTEAVEVLINIFDPEKRASAVEDVKRRNNGQGGFPNPADIAEVFRKVREVTEEAAEVEKASVRDDFVVKIDKPQTLPLVASYQSTTSLTLGGGGGTFGDIPTTNANVGVTIGSSFGVTLNDYGVINTSTDHVVRHRYELKAVKGSTFEKPSDLIEGGARGVFSGYPLFELSDMAKTNMPLASQAIFYSPDPGEKDLCIRLQIRHHLLKVFSPAKALERYGYGPIGGAVVNKVEGDDVFRRISWDQEWALPVKLSQLIPEGAHRENALMSIKDGAGRVQPAGAP